MNIMKKMTITRLASLLALILMFTQSYGQYTVTPPASDYEDYTTLRDGTKTAISGTEGRNFITVGKMLPYVVMPDAAFLSANYNFGTEAATGLTSSWAWTSWTNSDFTGADAGATITLGSTIADASRPAATTNPPDEVIRTYNYKDAGIGPLGDNLAVLSFSTTGVRYIRVIETSNASYGGCAGDITSMIIAVFQQPAMFFEDADDDNLELGDAVCGNQAANIVLHLVGAPVTNGFNLNWNISIDRVRTDNTVIANVDNNNLTGSNVRANVNWDIDDAFNPGNETFTWAALTAYTNAGVNGHYTLTNNYTFTVQNNNITRYTLTLTNINDDVSRKSDYWEAAANYTTYTNYGAPYTLTYATTPVQTLTFYVKPAPTTGNIYVIPN